MVLLLKAVKGPIWNKKSFTKLCSIKPECHPQGHPGEDVHHGRCIWLCPKHQPGLTVLLSSLTHGIRQLLAQPQPPTHLPAPWSVRCNTHPRGSCVTWKTSWFYHESPTCTWPTTRFGCVPQVDGCAFASLCPGGREQACACGSTRLISEAIPASLPTWLRETSIFICGGNVMSYWCMKVWDINFIMELKMENTVLALLPHLKDLCRAGNLVFLSPFLERPLIFNELTAGNLSVFINPPEVSIKI